jgi:hypothetical protein
VILGGLHGSRTLSPGLESKRLQTNDRFEIEIAPIGICYGIYLGCLWSFLVKVEKETDSFGRI